MKSKNAATFAAKKLLAQLKGHGWKIRVWENLGWHYCLETDRLAVYPAYSGKFHCLLKPHYSLFGSDSKTYRNPNHAVEACLAIARDHVAEYQKIIDEANSVYVK